MEKTICCPKCQSEDVRSIDNQPLEHPTKSGVEMFNSPRFDAELYMTFKCDGCNNLFDKVFTLTLQK